MSAEIDELKRALASGTAAEQAAAAEKLAQLGEESNGAAIELTAACANPALIEWATAALEGMGPPNPADVSRLIALLKSESADVGYWAATLLGRLGPAAAPATSSLVEALSKSPHGQVRERAALALGKIGPPAAAAAPGLTAIATSGSGRLATLAREALASVQK